MAPKVVRGTTYGGGGRFCMTGPSLQRKIARRKGRNSQGINLRMRLTACKNTQETYLHWYLEFTDAIRDGMGHEYCIAGVI